MEKVKGIFCQNSSCKNYFEDNCMLFFEKGTVHISGEGTCNDSEPGEHFGYKEVQDE